MKHTCRLALLALAGSCLTSGIGAQQAPPSRSAKSPAAATAEKPPAPADTGLVFGTFVSSRLDGKKLPVTDLATDDQGVQYVIEFAELQLTVKRNGEFRAALRYRQTLAAKGQKTSSEPLQRMTVFGTWTRDGVTIRFVPDPKRGGDGLRILGGTVAGKTITVPFDYQNGRVSRRANVILVYDPRII
ncbi:MAG: hypothetical protein NTX19_07335 [Gemmatimonadetes bacterium]|nr:hypothetical protein [Gemmatimonadota bacterium]